MKHIPRDISRLVRAACKLASLGRSIRPGQPHSLPGELVVSLTSYPPRFPKLHRTLQCLLSQDVAPDWVVLWVPHDDRELVPPRVEAMQKCGLTILGCEDVKSFNKIVHSLAAYPDTFIVTADDDMLYPRDWLRRLVEGYRHPDEAVCQHAKRLTVGADGHPLPYAEWPAVKVDERASALVQPMGSAGVLYPPGFLPERTLDASAFTRLCPQADDMWLYWCWAQAGKSARKVKPAKALHSPGTQGIGLKHFNDKAGGNDRQIAALIDAYGLPVRPLPALPPVLAPHGAVASRP